jgi:hypothetical protein
LARCIENPVAVVLAVVTDQAAPLACGVNHPNGGTTHSLGSEF